MAADFDAEFIGPGENAAGEGGFFVVGRVAEIGFCRTDVRRVDERKFAGLGDSERRGRQFVAFTGDKTKCIKEEQLQKDR